jgi:hypothetical protein
MEEKSAIYRQQGVKMRSWFGVRGWGRALVLEIRSESLQFSSDVGVWRRE